MNEDLRGQKFPAKSVGNRIRFSLGLNIHIASLQSPSLGLKCGPAGLLVSLTHKVHRRDPYGQQDSTDEVVQSDIHQIYRVTKIKRRDEAKWEHPFYQKLSMVD